MDEKKPGKVEFSSRYVSKFEGVPNDPKVIAAIDEWANAWGEFTYACKGAGILNSEPDLPDDIEPLADRLEAKVKALESVIHKERIIFTDYELGRIGWADDAGNESHVELSV